ncbi:MAG: tetratricopeptide repeat protein, partial [Tumebacillaceae bacterium]
MSTMDAQSSSGQESRTRGLHVRSIAVFGVFSVLDLVVFTLALVWESWQLLLLRVVLAWGAVLLAQPLKKWVFWSSRQALTSITLLLLPVLGSLIAFYWSTRRTNPQGAWQDMPEEKRSRRSVVDLGGVIDVVPMIDVLDSDDSVRKKKALVKAQLMGSHVQTSIVRKGLEDADPEVRYYAASLLARLDAVHANRVRQVEKRLAKDEQNPLLWNALALAYKNILEQDIAEEELSLFYQEKRLAALDRSLSLNNRQPLAGIERAEALFALGRVEEAEMEAQRWLAVGDEWNDRAIAVLIEVAFQRNDQEKLEQYLEMVQEISHVPQHLQGLIRLW